VVGRWPTNMSQEFSLQSWEDEHAEFNAST